MKAFLKLVHLAEKSNDLTKELETIQESLIKQAASQQQQKPDLYKKPITNLIVKSRNEYFVKFKPLVSQNLKAKTIQGEEFCLLNLTKLVLSNCELKEIHSSVFELKQLENLNLSENKLSEIDGFRFNRLVDLNLSQNEIKRIGDSCSMPRLSRLDLSSNQLVHIDKRFFSTFKNISHLRLNSNRIRMFNSDFGYQMTRLIQLNAAYNHLSQLPYSLASLRLEMLEINDNPLESELKIEQNKKYYFEQAYFPTLAELSARKVINKRFFKKIYLVVYRFNKFRCC